MEDIRPSIFDDYQWSRELAFSAEQDLKSAEKTSYAEEQRNYLLRGQAYALLSVAAAVRGLRSKKERYL